MDAVLASRTFPARAEQVSAARRLTQETLASYPKFDADLVELLVSEVVTNSVIHSRSPAVEVEIALTKAGDLRVTVTDRPRTARIPHVRSPEPTEPGGRGLFIVSRCATRWRVEPDDPQGRVAVWFEVAEGDGAAAWTDAAVLAVEGAAPGR
ncbi:ATP-binding protein [Streptomyces lunaelactis]|uniref:ATP-binding protein n=1 Tax=Streptomyces lunaelactis TaxID=1535768 RepID=UPI0015846841|nr:ATP-binding protein [Streptomyces lunaelactis]NUK86724.1 ATP-binding protein [Streptomyces lunaelactis]